MTDYLEFTTINTPSIERQKLDVGDIFINQVRHTKCGWIIRSKNRHDWVTCKCGELSLDGGSWYQAMNGDITNAENHVVMYNELHRVAA
ncbi:hypothetical protein ACFVX3_24685 [Rhodococcus erythropolis]|jgi:hypothetical protein